MALNYTQILLTTWSFSSFATSSGCCFFLHSKQLRRFRNIKFICGKSLQLELGQDFVVWHRVNSLGKIWDRIKLKAFADNEINAIRKIIFVFDEVENTVGKGENTFSPFPAMF